MSERGVERAQGFSLPTSKVVVTDGRMTFPRSATIGMALGLVAAVKLSEFTSVKSVLLSIMAVLYNIRSIWQVFLIIGIIRSFERVEFNVNSPRLLHRREFRRNNI